MSKEAKAKTTKKSAKKDEPKSRKVNIEPMQIDWVEIEIVGDTMLTVHRFDEKNAHMILSKQQGKAVPRGKRDPEAEFLGSLYQLPPVKGKKKRYGFPAGGFRECLATAAKRFHKIDKVQVYGALWIKGEMSLPGEHPEFGSLGPRDCVEIIGEPIKRTDIVRLAGPGRTADLRFRPMFLPWSMKVHIRYDATVFDQDTIVRLVHSAGTRVGIGEYRVEKGGDWGMFTPANIREVHAAAD
jgi:hypothetical protein